MIVNIFFTFVSLFCHYVSQFLLSTRASVPWFITSILFLIIWFNSLSLEHFISNYDIVLFQETQTDDLDIDKVEHYFKEHGYTCYLKNRTKIAKHRSGGIAVCVKDKWKDSFIYIKTKSKFVSWFSLKDKFALLGKNLLFGCVYLPPEGTRYASYDCFQEVEREMLDLCRDHLICLVGDFNAHVGNLEDFVSVDDYVREDVGMDMITFDNLDAESTLKVLGTPVHRCTFDTHKPNNFGYRLIQLCKDHGLFIINGRCGVDQYSGDCTTTKNSTVDYVISDGQLLSYVHRFEILEFDPLFSDIHISIAFSARLYSLDTLMPFPILMFHLMQM